MSNKDSKPSGAYKIGIRKAKEKREKFLQVEIQIWDNLSPFALKVYGQLRKLIDFKEEHDEIEITVEALAIKSGISVRKTYSVLNELEKEHFLIIRMNQHHWRYGQTNSFDIAQAYGFFKPVEPVSIITDNPPIVQNLTTPAQYAEGTAQYAVATAQYADPYKELDLSIESSYMCGEKELPTQHTIKKLKQEKAEQTALDCEEAKTLFKAKFEGRAVTMQDIFDSCKEHYEQKSLWATKDKFVKWLKREKAENYPQIGTHAHNKSNFIKLFSDEEDALLAEYKHYLKVFGKTESFEKWFPSEEKRARIEMVLAKEQEFLDCQHVKNAKA